MKWVQQSQVHYSIKEFYTFNKNNNNKTSNLNNQKKLPTYSIYAFEQTESLFMHICPLLDTISQGLSLVDTSHVAGIGLRRTVELRG